jgi:hypothetical protein
MTARTFDPFAVERPRLRLGDHGEWELGELHDARHQQFQEWHERFKELSGDDGTKLVDIARSVGEMVSIACIDAAEAPDVLADLCDFDKHGDDARGLQTLVSIVEFLAGWASGEASAGEG